MTLESSDRDFAARFAPHAAHGLLYPQPEGSPLLEFVAGGRVLYLFDRSGPYAAQPGHARVVVHGVLQAGSVQLVSPERGETLSVQGVSALEGCGQVTHVVGQVWVVQARLPLVLACFEGLPPVAVGQHVVFRTLPPLHGFIVP
ncbi:hypothetical protein HLB42_00120 [Deinococcus sp. D7000]|uniref:Uncharacterized protein n=1 Tax=Deinococcus radiopugnans ATCC 19172 TaxID=585398 RepID=A0A5C4Y6W1_9DEIO|nr:hypothetical protein [Deinococcus radiopugnans]MBB6016383.1 hypothetical protein [Deinococcus radiopugnans ATCC 19172]QLG09350.1 hypothetical protein HLB42_00120 [Deinococcus sp. D7000]TNM71346.1 hypothetical protein FHR04_09225 [Deinococcus radiopugnans ATCC 19172]